MIDGAVTLFQPLGTKEIKVLYSGWDNGAANKAWLECEDAGEVCYIRIRSYQALVERTKKNQSKPKVMQSATPTKPAQLSVPVTDTVEDTVEDEEEISIGGPDEGDSQKRFRRRGRR